ncbi:MAG TPA: hypothetical protein P5105_01805 [Victivallales bacterium]|nr:hypothetical protein [Victivallales bacterium]
MDINNSSMCKSCMNRATENIELPNNFRPGRGRWVTMEEYLRRFSLCKKCPYFIAKSTCAHCGCLIKYLITLKDKSCPAPDKVRW